MPLLLALNPPLLAFWQWGSAGMLAFGLASAIPILLHLWSRRPRQTQPWAAIRFLEAALQRTARRRRLASWLLLLLRCGLLLAWAAALAAPRWVAPSAAAGPAVPSPTHVCLVLDRSYSMQYASEGGARFDQAKAQAQALVQSAPAGTVFSLLAMDQSPRAIIPRPTADRTAVVAEIDRLEPAQTPASLSATLALVESTLRQAARERGDRTPQRVCWYTDLQRLPWADLRAGPVQTLWSAVRQRAAVELIDLGRREETNLAVVQAACEPPLPTAWEPVQLVAELRNFGREDRPRQEVTLFVDDQPVAQRTVDLPAGGSVQVAFTHRFARAGERIVQFRLAEDALPLDNQRGLCVPVRETLRVLCLGDRPADTRYLALALAPHAQTTPGWEVVERQAAAMPADDWARFDCVILSNLAALDDLRGLRRFLQEGGGLIIFLGARVDVGRYQRLWEETPPLLPARLASPTVVGDFRLRPRDEQHPIVAPFRGLPQSGLLTTPVWRYVRLIPLPGATTVVEFDTSDPALVTAEVGQGRCVLVATAATLSAGEDRAGPEDLWTALPTWPSFPPLVHEMVRYVLATRLEQRQRQVGEPLEGFFPLQSATLLPRGDFDPAVGSTPSDRSGGSSRASMAAEHSHPAGTRVHLFGPDGLHWTTPAIFKQDRLHYAFPPAPRAGVYEVRTEHAASKWVVNVDPAESDLTRVEPALIQELQAAAPATATAGEAPAPRTVDLGWAMLTLVLLLLLLEPWLAGRRPGRGR